VLRAVPAGISGKLNAPFRFVNNHGAPRCVLIDEYDNLANTVPARHDEAAFDAFTHGEGFCRAFFATLKAGTEQGGVERLFMTGVSPVTLDDVTTGFSIADNLRLEPEFNERLGFTEAEARGLLAQYRDLGAFDQDVDAALATMRTWYGGCRFSRRPGGGLGSIWATPVCGRVIRRCASSAWRRPSAAGGAGGCEAVEVDTRTKRHSKTRRAATEEGRPPPDDAAGADHCRAASRGPCWIRSANSASSSRARCSATANCRGWVR